LRGLRAVRSAGVKRAETNLARATATGETARRAVEDARRALEANRDTTRRAALEHASDRGRRRVADVQRAQAHLEHRRREAQGLVERLEGALRELERAEGDVRAARAELAQAQARLEAVDRHHAAWERRRRRRADARAELEAEDRACHRLR
jgi:chromosome segregation ATPase